LQIRPKDSIICKDAHECVGSNDLPGVRGKSVVYGSYVVVSAQSGRELNRGPRPHVDKEGEALDVDASDVNLCAVRYTVAVGQEVASASSIVK